MKIYFIGAISSAIKLLASVLSVYLLHDSEAVQYKDMLLLLMLAPLFDLGRVNHFKRSVIDKSESANLAKNLTFNFIIFLSLVPVLIWYCGVELIVFAVVVAIAGASIVNAMYLDVFFHRNISQVKKIIIIEFLCSCMFVVTAILTGAVSYSFMIFSVIAPSLAKLIIVFKKINGSLSSKGGVIKLSLGMLPLQILAYMCSVLPITIPSIMGYDIKSGYLVDYRFAQMLVSISSLISPIYWSNLIEKRNIKLEFLVIFSVLFFALLLFNGSPYISGEARWNMYVYFSAFSIFQFFSVVLYSRGIVGKQIPIYTFFIITGLFLFV